MAADDLLLVERLDPLLERAASRLRPGAFVGLDVVVLHLYFDAPDVLWSVDGLRRNLWLGEAVAGYRAGKYPDPLQPWRLGGRPNGSRYFHDRDEFVAAVRLTAKHIQRHEPPVTKSKVAAQFHRQAFTTTYRQLLRWLDDYHVDWQADILSSLR